MRPIPAASVAAILAATAWAGAAAGDRPPAAALEAPLKVTEPVGVARVQAPVCGGVPVGPLGVGNVAELVLLDQEGKPVRAQLTPMVIQEDGTLLWVLAEFLADLDARGTKTFTLRKGRGAAPALKQAVTVQETAKDITLTNGLVKVACSKERFNLFDQVWVDRNADGTFSDDERMLDAAQPAALALVRGTDGQAFTSRDGTVEKITFEDPGPVRTTVRVDGTFGDGKGGQWLKYTVRLTLWAGRPDLRVLYTLRNVNPKVETQEQVKHGTVTVKLDPPAGMTHCLVGAARPMFSQVTGGEQDAIKKSQWHSKVRLAQVGPPEAVLSRTHRQFYNLKDFADAGYRVEHFQPGGRTPITDIGFKAGGWIDLSGDTVGCQVWLRNFSHDCPKRIEAAIDGTVTVEVIPEYDGNQQPYYAGGGYWLGDRSHWSYELNFRFHGRPLLTEADWAAYRREFSAYVPATAETAARAEGIALQAGNPLQLVSTPEWYTRTGQMWGPVVSLEEEAAANKALGRTQVAPVRPQPASAMATEFLHYENYHYRSEWDEPRDALLEFLRTGIWDLYKRAHSFGRNYRDVGVWWSEGQPMEGRARNVVKGAAGPIDRWGKFCGCHNYGAGLIDLWLITGDRSYRDAGVDFGYVQATPPVVKGGFGDRGWARKMAAVLRTYQVTRDPALRKWLVANCRPPVPSEALRQDGRALLAGAHQGSWMTGLSSHAIWHNWLMLQGDLGEIERDDYRDGILGVAWNVGTYWWFDEYGGGPYYIQFTDTGRTANGGGTAYTLSCVDMTTRGYLLTGDRRLLEAAKKFWNAVNGDDPTTVHARLQDLLGMGSYSFWARQLMYELAHPRADAAPPAAVTDLKAEALGGGRVKLTWTAPADQGGGQVVEYQAKHAPCPMVAFPDYKFPEDKGKKWTFWAGYNVAGEPKPGSPGAAETMTVTGVPAGTRHFALVARDNSSNESALSNGVAVEVK